MRYTLTKDSFGKGFRGKEFLKLEFLTKSEHLYTFERIGNVTYLIENGSYSPIEGLAFHTHKSRNLQDALTTIDNFELDPSICFWGNNIVDRITSKIKYVDVTYLDNSISRYYFDSLTPSDLEESLIDRHFFGNPSKAFLQSNGSTINSIPSQGIKLHISVRDYLDYVDTLKKIVPVLQKNDVTFKVLKPNKFSRFMEGQSTQQGKYITIYPCKCNFQAVLNELFDVLNDAEGIIPVLGDIHLGGRVFGRYGSMMGPYVYDQNGTAYLDDRSRAYPIFIDGFDLQDFIKSVA